jgi:hypothetical protein
MINGIRITKEELLTLNENDLMFITNPGRMGDEDGSTFIIKKDNNYITYRVDGWMYPNGRDKNNISMDDMFNKFPMWKESWHNYYNDKSYSGKYIYLYMGFGNGLCIDKSIYDKYNKYLQEKLELSRKESKEEIPDSALLYGVWYEAFINMINDNK